MVGSQHVPDPRLIPDHLWDGLGAVCLIAMLIVVALSVHRAFFPPD